MRRLLIAVALGAALLAALSIGCPGRAKAAQPSETQIYRMLRHFGSPLADEAYTVAAFARAHPEFDVVDFYAVLWAESSLGKGARSHHNVASIKGGKVGTLWRDLRTGTFSGGYNRYATFRDGQRAALRLILERYGGSLLRGDGLHRYYGYGVGGWSAYQARVAKAHRLIEAAL